MAKLHVIGFTGEIPKLGPRLLPHAGAQNAVNTRLTDGGLTPIRKSKILEALSSPPANDDGTIYFDGTDWLSWSGLVHVAPGPVATDRLYITGDGAPKMRTGGTTYDLAVVAPTTKLTGTIGGTPTGTLVQTRLYVYTFVTSFGEESEPCPISDEVLWTPGETVTLSGFQLGSAARGVTKQRIYRSQTGTSGGTVLQLIAERNTSTANYVDSIAPEDFITPLPSLSWTPPISSLSGLVSMPNGMMAAFDGKDIYFCEPYRPHAWPSEYVMTVDYDVVGLGVFGSTLVIMTTGMPYMIRGTHPTNMIQDRLELNLPCVSARSIQDLGYAVAYASHDGVVVASESGAQIMTQSLMTREQWRRYSPQTMVGGQREGRYFVSYDYTDFEGFNFKGTLIFDLSGELPFLIRTDIETRAFYHRIEDGHLYYLNEGGVYRWDSPDASYATQTWRSKLFTLPRPTSFGAILIDADPILSKEEIAAIQAVIDAATAANDATFASGDPLGGAVNGHYLNESEVNGDTLEWIPEFKFNLSVNIYADGALVASVSKWNAMARLPAGFRARNWEIEVSGDMRVSQIALASTGAELMEI